MDLGCEPEDRSRTESQTQDRDGGPQTAGLTWGGQQGRSGTRGRVRGACVHVCFGLGRRGQQRGRFSQARGEDAAPVPLGLKSWTKKDKRPVSISGRVVPDPHEPGPTQRGWGGQTEALVSNTAGEIWLAKLGVPP